MWWKGDEMGDGDPFSVAIGAVIALLIVAVLASCGGGL